MVFSSQSFLTTLENRLIELTNVLKSNFWLKATLLMASTLTIMAGAIIAPGLPEMSNFFEGSAPEVYVKAILTTPAISIVLFSATIGLLADRIGRKKTLIIALLLYAISGVSGLFIENIYTLLFSRFVLGLGVAGIMNTATALVGDYFDANERTQFLGLQAGFVSIGGIVFLNLGGLLAEWSWRGPFSLYALAFIITPLAFYCLPQVKRNIPDNKANPAIMTLTSKNKAIAFKVFALGFLGMMFFYLIPVQIPYLLKNSFQLSATLVGLAISLSTLSGAMTSFLYQKIAKRISPGKIYMLSFMFIGLGYILIGCGNGSTAVFAGLAIAGIGTGLMMPNGSLILLALLPESIKGKWLGGLTTAIFLAQFLSPLFIAPFIAQQGIQNAFIFVAMISLALAGILSLSKTNFLTYDFTG